MSHVATDTNWAVRECADAELGDERRTKRLVELANVLGQHPTAALPEACGDGGMLKAAYRFFDNDAIEAQDMLQSHLESTYRRLDHVSVVLAVPDTTEVNWTGHPAPQGLGPLGPTCDFNHILAELLRHILAAPLRLSLLPATTSGSGFTHNLAVSPLERA